MFTNAFQGYTYSYPHKTAYRSIEPAISLAKAWETERVDSLFLYLHIPFCEFRCGFCNLFTHVQPEHDLVDRYLNSVQLQAEQIRKAIPEARFTQLAIGGGTPTYLSIPEWDRVFATLKETLGVSPRDIPFSCEASPATIDREKLEYLKAQGVDRLSLGVQSFRSEETGKLGRPQKDDQVHQVIEEIKQVNFPVMNLDLIYGAESQSTDSWIQSVDAAIHHGAEEIYLYPLYVRELTGLTRIQTNNSGLEDQSDWDQQRLDAYRAARDYLLSSNYEQVSLRMFRKLEAGESETETTSRPVYHCQSDGMLGLGCGARSYTRNLHYSYEYAVHSKAVLSIIHDFCRKTEEDFSQIQYGFQMDDEDQRRRFILLGLLQSKGLDLLEYELRFGSIAMEDHPELMMLVINGYMHWDDTRLQLTETGLELSDAIGPWFYSAQVSELMESYECR